MKTLEEAIQKTIQAVETTAPKAWELAVRAQRIEATVELIVCLIVLSFAVVLALFVRNVHQKRLWGNEERALFCVVTGTIAVVCAFATLVSLPGDIARYLNPEIYAAKAIVEAAGR